jgi:hypothetical protein
MILLQAAIAFGFFVIVIGVIELIVFTPLFTNYIYNKFFQHRTKGKFLNVLIAMLSSVFFALLISTAIIFTTIFLLTKMVDLTYS